MKNIKTINDLINKIKITGDIPGDVVSVLDSYGCPNTAIHSKAVAAEAGKLAEKFGANRQKSETAGWLHDISAIIPNGHRIDAARERGIEVLAEEEIFPLIIHQKLSAEIASCIFKIEDTEILGAIGCHTTLKKDASDIDKIVFIADKIQWDQHGNPPYLNELLEKLSISLDHGTFYFLDYLLQRETSLKVVHPWLKDAHSQLQKLL